MTVQKNHAEQPTNRLLRDIILDAILKAIDRTGSKNEAARELGITKPTVLFHLKRGFSDQRKFKIKQISHFKCEVVWPGAKK
jgi:hypothetical protein